MKTSTYMWVTFIIQVVPDNEGNYESDHNMNRFTYSWNVSEVKIVRVLRQKNTFVFRP